MFGLFKKKQPPRPPTQFPPVPPWRPAFAQPIERIVDRVAYYTDRKSDFAAFRHGTCVILPADLSEDDAIAKAKDVLARIFSFHPDMDPHRMDDGNVLVQYNHPAMNVVLDDVAESHWAEIERNHLDALTPSEVLITPLGPNKFDTFGKKALLGRCFMFMDAQSPEVLRVVRAAVHETAGAPRPALDEPPGSE